MADPRIVPGAVFDTPFEEGCIVVTTPNHLGWFEAADSEGVVCTFVDPSILNGAMPLIFRDAPCLSSPSPDARRSTMPRKPRAEVYAIQAAKLSTEHLETLLARLTPNEWRKRRAIQAELDRREELDTRSTFDRQMDSFNERNTQGGQS